VQGKGKGKDQRKEVELESAEEEQRSKKTRRKRKRNAYENYSNALQKGFLERVDKQKNGFKKWLN
jgi:hypothetical protein